MDEDGLSQRPTYQDQLTIYTSNKSLAMLDAHHSTDQFIICLQSANISRHLYEDHRGIPEVLPLPERVHGFSWPVSLGSQDLHPPETSSCHVESVPVICSHPGPDVAGHSGHSSKTEMLRTHAITCIMYSHHVTSDNTTAMFTM